MKFAHLTLSILFKKNIEQFHFLLSPYVYNLINVSSEELIVCWNINVIALKPYLLVEKNILERIQYVVRDATSDNVFYKGIDNIISLYTFNHDA